MYKYECARALAQHGEKGVNMIIAFYQLLNVLGNQMIFLRIKRVKKIATVTFVNVGFSGKA